MNDDQPVKDIHYVKNRQGQVMATLTLWGDNKATICVRQTGQDPEPECYTSTEEEGEALFGLAKDALDIRYTTLEDGLKRSVREEEAAVRAYDLRGQKAAEEGDKGTARIYEHVQGEEERHGNWLRNRLNDVLMPPWTPPVKRDG